MANSVDFQGFTLRIGNEDGPPETFTDVGKVESADWDGGQPNVNIVTTSDDSAVRKRPGLTNRGQYTFPIIYFPTDAGQILVKAAADLPSKVISYQLEFVDDEATPQTYTTDFEAFCLSVQKTGEADGVLRAVITLEVDDLPVETIV